MVSVPSYARDLKKNGSTMASNKGKQKAVADDEEMLEEAKQDMINARQVELEKTFGKHDDHVRELFHMEKYKSMLSFIPEVGLYSYFFEEVVMLKKTLQEAKQENTPVFRDFKKAWYDIVDKSSSSSGSRRTRTRSGAQSELSQLGIAPGRSQSISMLSPTTMPIASGSTSPRKPKQDESAIWSVLSEVRRDRNQKSSKSGGSSSPVRRSTSMTASVDSPAAESVSALIPVTISVRRGKSKAISVEETDAVLEEPHSTSITVHKKKLKKGKSVVSLSPSTRSSIDSVLPVSASSSSIPVLTSSKLRKRSKTSNNETVQSQPMDLDLPPRKKRKTEPLATLIQGLNDHQVSSKNPGSTYIPNPITSNGQDHNHQKGISKTTRRTTRASNATESHPILPPNSIRAHSLPSAAAPVPIRRLKLLLGSRPPLPYSSPFQRPDPSRHGSSITKFLQSYVTSAEGKDMTKKQLEESARSDAHILERIHRVRQEGRLPPDIATAADAITRRIWRKAVKIPNFDVSTTEKGSPPTCDAPHADVWGQVVSQVVDYGVWRKKQLSSSVGKHIYACYGAQGASQVASRVKALFEVKEARNQRANQKAKAQDDKKLRMLAKTTVKMVVAEWKKAVYSIREQERLKEEAEELRRGHEHLDALLDQSGQLLETQQLDLLKGADGSRSRSRSTTAAMTANDSEEESADGEVDEEDTDGDEGGTMADLYEDLARKSSVADEDAWPMLDAEEGLVELEIGTDIPNQTDEGGTEPDEDGLRTSALLVSDIMDDIAPDDGVFDLMYPSDEEPVDVPTTAPLDKCGMLTSEPAVGVSSPASTAPFNQQEDAVMDNGAFIWDNGSPQTPVVELNSSHIIRVHSPAPDAPGWKNDGIINENGQVETLDIFVARKENMPMLPEAPKPPSTVTSSPPAKQFELDAPDTGAPSIQNAPAEDALQLGFDVPNMPELPALIVQIEGKATSAPATSEDATLVNLNIPISTELVPTIFTENAPTAGLAPSEITTAASDTSLIEHGVLESDEEESEDDEVDSIPPYLKPFAVTRVHWDPKSKLTPPLLLRGVLRPYQQTGLEWLASHHTNHTNAILADEMGLGKTIQTIALLAHLACDRGIWGPHLIVVPTSVLLNWEMEFKKFLPGFKTLSYHGSTKRRKELRQGWTDKYHFNVCITSYTLATRDAHILKKKPWYYMILDEAHMIKNFKSQRWNILLPFRSFRRLLLTGTPLQNSLTELWALLQFLMSGSNFANKKEFEEWFSNPLERAIEAGIALDEETQQRVSKLHLMLKPYLLRRLKRDVEKELPSKFEHIMLCPLSKRQRYLYDEFMARANTKEALQSGSYHKIANILMQLRKVCNHPNLFEVRSVVTSFAMERSAISNYEIKELLLRRRWLESEDETVNLDFLGLQFTQYENRPLLTALETRRLEATSEIVSVLEIPRGLPPTRDTRTIAGYKQWMDYHRQLDSASYWRHRAYINQVRCKTRPLYGSGLLNVLRQCIRRIVPFTELDCRLHYLDTPVLASQMVVSYASREERMASAIDRFAFATPPVVARDMPEIALSGYHDIINSQPSSFDVMLHRISVKLQIAFPDPSLLQYDCGKLQQLARLLREKKGGGHRVLIFTQMTRILDILELFLNFHGYLYLRLDGATKIEDRQYITERFNADARIFCFIASSRSGGVGINLTGADTVIFYDSDFNPQMDRQCEDRAHRIGQMRDVHIYRCVSQHTVEEAMLLKADQKRHLDHIVIQKGEYDWRTLFQDEATSALTRREMVDFDEVEDKMAADAAAAEERAIFGGDELDFGDEGGTVGKTVTIAGDAPIDNAAIGIDGAVVAAEDGMVEAEDEEEVEGSVADYMLAFVRRDPDFFRDWRI